MTVLAPLVHSIVHRRYGIEDDTVLNQGAPQISGADSIAAELKQAINSIKAQAIDTQKGCVNYAVLADSMVYGAYRDCSRRLQFFDPAVLTNREQRLAFWINLYNALIIDAVIAFGVEKSVNDIPGFFWKAAYCIKGNRFSTMDIEYGVLRANTGHPAIPGPQFARADTRRQYSLGSLDPRIHFALVCAARSCPPIAVYDAERIDEQLDLAARAFINGGGVGIDRERNEVRLSKIFQWYATDFGGPWMGLGDNQPVLAYISPFLLDERDREWLTSADRKVRFVPYDWTLNRQ